MHLRRTALLALAATAGAAGTATAAERSLAGPATVKPLGKVTYVARGLAPDRYALLAVRKVERDGTTYRCTAFMAAPRKAAGTEAFKGSLPDGVTCVDDAGTTFQARTRTYAGRWKAVVCHTGADASCEVGTAVRRPLVVRR